MIDEASYQDWRSAKLEAYPRSIETLFVKIGGLIKLSEAEKTAIVLSCRRSNMAIYQCRDGFVDHAAVCAFAANFGLQRLDHHLCTNDDGVSELSVAAQGVRTDYAPYSNHRLSWHTDGYYNADSKMVRAVVLHCVNDAATGGENALLDPEIAYIRLRDEDPRFITALEHPECMTIPANSSTRGEIRPPVCGPVFSRDRHGGAIHMRYSARKINIQWRDDEMTRAARDFLTELLADDNGPVFRYRLQPGEGLVSNNVLHNRTAFEDDPGSRRLIYRARFYDRMHLAR